MVQPHSAFSGFQSRRARFELDRSDPAHLRAEIDRIWPRLDAAGLRTTHDLRAFLHRRGFEPDLPRLDGCQALMTSDAAGQGIDPETLQSQGTPELIRVLATIVDDALAIPQFGHFGHTLTNLFAYTQDAGHGDVADYIPELAHVDPDAFGLAACSIDGQRFDIGDSQTAFSLQSTVKPLNYALALALNGEALVHRHVGREPSGRRFNELTLDERHRPHNPMINAGAIMCSALIKPNFSIEDRFSLVQRFWGSAVGDAACGFDEQIYQSELATADRNRALTQLMSDAGAFPEGTDTAAALDLYFRTCAMTLDCRGLSVVAATLANGGVCPLTGHRIGSTDIIRNTLSLMLSCGMYDFSGEFAFTVGLPAKSGVSGALMLVIPGVCGLALWSPRLDRLGNSVRGVEFSRRLVDAFPFHIFAGLAGR